ncbi:MAG: LysR family transcriptional regulator [Burkholderiales bacterium]
MFLLAVAEHGSTLAAARALQVNQSTVQRRLAELERRIGRPLVARQQAGYRLTEFGRSLLPQAQRVQQAAQALQRQVSDSAHDTAGVVRVTCPEPLVARLAGSPLLEHFRARHPTLKVEFVMGDRYLDLAKGEADIVLRSGDTEDGGLVGRKIGDSLWAVYASRAYVERHGAPATVAELKNHLIVGFDESMAGHRAASWLRRVAPDARIAARNHSVLGLLHSVKAGVGVAPLPTAIADAEGDLVRVLGPIAELTRIWRILTLPQLRQVPRVAAFFDFMVEETDALRPIITG